LLDNGRHSILGVNINAVDYDTAVERITAAAKAGQPFGVSALAVHGVMTGVLDKVHRHRINDLELVVPDGMPVCWALNILHGTSLSDRVYGPNLTLKVCQRAATEGLPVYFYGSTRQVVDALCRNLVDRFPSLRIAGSQPSLFRCISRDEMAGIARRITATGARITFIGLGCPRQEVWAYENRELLSMPLVAVGAAFDFHAGSLPQAPLTLQSMGLEWFYRLVKEPNRLWKRYLGLNPLYMFLLFLQASHLYKFDPVQKSPPTTRIGYG
jgi:N-acetylglucosaminyldiphosphoundecaprenol N-acetyl-beta-D-mannosaminyltransferase